ncbi:GNAT family acetyltransferase [Companilactobacillus farciminis]|nr:GNAT family acetyltransferase [Companilactobacillus farciminis]
MLLYEKARRDYFVVVDDFQEVVGGAGFAEFDLEKNIAELQNSTYLKLPKVII